MDLKTSCGIRGSCATLCGIVCVVGCTTLYYYCTSIFSTLHVFRISGSTGRILNKN